MSTLEANDIESADCHREQNIGSRWSHKRSYGYDKNGVQYYLNVTSDISVVKWLNQRKDVRTGEKCITAVFVNILLIMIWIKINFFT